MKEFADPTLVRVINNSPSGARICTDDPISLHASILLEYTERQLPGFVRYSRYQGGSYVTGIQFSFDCKWAAECFQAKYLLDTQVLLGNLHRRLYERHTPAMSYTDNQRQYVRENQ